MQRSGKTMSLVARTIFAASRGEGAAIVTLCPDFWCERLRNVLPEGLIIRVSEPHPVGKMYYVEVVPEEETK